jgi:hypothetical protein
MCGKYSGADAICCPHCGTAFVPEELRTAVSARLPLTEVGPSSPEEAPLQEPLTCETTERTILRDYKLINATNVTVTPHEDAA